MRVIFTAWAWPSHMYAMVPLAWAARARGHDVLVASQPALTNAISRTGLPAAPVGQDVDAVATFRDIVGPRPGAPGSSAPSDGAAPPGARSGTPSDSAAPPGARSGTPSDSAAPPGARSGTPSDSAAPPGARSGTPSDSAAPPGARSGTPSDSAAPPGPRPGSRGPRVLDLLVSLAEAMVDDLIRLAKGWRADLIVFEPTAFAGPLAAAALDIPAVRHLYGTDLMSVVGRFLPDALGPLREKLGVETVDPFGVATIDPCPAGLQVPVGSRRMPVRYVPFNGSGALPAGLPRAGGRPRVCVTWGTTLDRLDRDLFLAGRVTRAITELDVDVMVAVAAGQRELLGPLPPTVSVVEAAPLHLVLPRCDLVVAHGGAGTLLTSVSHGLPQLLIPRLPDHVLHAARLAEAGAGTVLEPAAADPGTIRDRLTELLTAPGYADAAKRLRQEMHDQPPPALLVGELERLAAGPQADHEHSPRQ